MENKRIVWGACWFNESTDVVVSFFKNAILDLTEKGYDVYPIIFDARYEHNVEEHNKIKKSINKILIIENNFNIFPNKNYGIAIISEYAKKVKARLLAIVDPDWNVKEYSDFINNIIKPVTEGRADIVIPDIGSEAGRSNLLVGKVALALFYPDYSNTIKTAFPGSLIGLSDKICNITLNSEYHYDWGGEWDIISSAIKNNYRLGSVKIDVTNVRHRANSYKIFDAYQIWRAILSNEDIITRYSNIKTYKEEIIAEDRFSFGLLNENYSAKEQIEFVIKNAENETQRQLLYMLLYPLASILGEIDYIPNIEKNDVRPYEKDKIGYISSLAIHCCRIALLKSNLTVEQIVKNAKKMTRNFWSDWNKESQEKALKHAKKCIYMEGQQ